MGRALAGRSLAGRLLAARSGGSRSGGHPHSSGEKGTLKASVYSYDFTPTGQGHAIHKDVAYELDKSPEDNTEPRLEKHCAPAIRAHMKDFLTGIVAGPRVVL